MKKVFALLAIVGFVACNNAQTTVNGVDTASQTYKDSVAAASAASAAKMDSAAVKMDSAAAKMDSAAKK